MTESFNTERTRPSVKALINGQQVSYDAAASTFNPELYPEPRWKYLGQGVVYSVGGVLQTSDRQQHFWRYA